MKNYDFNHDLIIDITIIRSIAMDCITVMLFDKVMISYGISSVSILLDPG